ncbi:UvrD-helicase domain-containing protein [Desulfobulbus oligotrophicus]|uniref:DNA 3'-5' helicase II n=1 Tax=Desulfobulbus oligotrophicus TaxID=1909699 RepID=A0A7T6AQQ4_9BACT|nr:ATP-dependent helicase [Desulfobulbus oligotrophicus]QQG66053.1 ATP-dependent helicase [Desulfobulbus oligotrophicus]
MNLTKGQTAIMQADGHLLVTGGPGSGKTTISILKASQIASQNLLPGQKVLFLSFARATVSRVIEAIEYEQKIPKEQKSFIVVDTYHSFFWRILKTYGYLIGLPRRIKVLTPPNEAIALSVIRSAFPSRKLTDIQKLEKKNAEAAELLRLAKEEGKVCFDLYAPNTYQILQGSKRICHLIASRYPTIILDEFQDTNAAQWSVVQKLGGGCRLLALADPEQRIYDWIGADPARLDHFRETFIPIEVDLKDDNHRSGDTEIAMFGRDVLAGKFRKNAYNGIGIAPFTPSRDPAMTKLITTVYSSRKRLIDQGISGWSLAILVPTKKMTRLVSEAFLQPPAKLTVIPHFAAIEMEAAILGAEVIALLMQPNSGTHHFEEFIDLMCNYFQGKGGDEPTQGALQEADKIRKNYDAWVDAHAKGKTLRKNSILINMHNVYEQACSVALTGDPDKDWVTIRGILEKGTCPRLREISLEVRNLRLLQRGSQLRQELSQDWLSHGVYLNALEVVRRAFVQAHFDLRAKPESGVVVMNMHKAKGKQFDEVIIFEGWPVQHKGQTVSNPDRIVRANSIEQANSQARQNFCVSITRSKRQTTILTPKNDPCVLLPSNDNA